MLRALRNAGRRGVRLFSTETSIEEEQAMVQLREVLKTKSFAAPEKVDMSPELRDKVGTEFQAFVKEFVFDHDFQDEIQNEFNRMLNDTNTLHDILNARESDKMVGGNMHGFQQFPQLKRSAFDEPYSSQELFLRRLFHFNQMSEVGGSVTSDSYKPYENVFRPPPIEKTSVATLLAAGAHLGHITSRVRANMLPYIYGERDGIHLIDLDQTLTCLRRAASVVEGVAQQGGVVLFVGTRDGQAKSVEVAADRAGGFYVHTRWAPGTLTNATNMTGDWARLEVDMADEPTGRQLGSHLQRTIIKPDVVVVLNPVENRPLLHECITARVPTIGVVDSDSEPSLLTYPVPANDDSARTCDLILGVLSNAAKRGRELRLDEVANFKKASEVAKSGEGFNAA